MSFLTGLEFLTGHRPGALTGFTMKDLFEKDMWDRLPQTWSGQMGTPAHLKANPMDRRTNRAGEPMETNWYNRNAGVAPVPEEITSRNRPDVPQQGFSSPIGPEGALAGPPRYPQMRPYVRQNVQSIPVPGWTPPRTQAEMVQEIGPYWGMGDPYSGWGGYLGSAKKAHMGMGASGYQVPQGYHPADPGGLLDMTTVKKEVDDPGVPNTVTQTIKQKVPANTLLGTLDQFAKKVGPPPNIPISTLMNMGRSGFLDKLGSGIGEQWSNLWDASILRRGTGAWDVMKDLARKRHEEEMLRRQRGY